MLQSHDQLGTPGTLGPAAPSRPALDVLAATGGLLAGAVLAGFQIHRFHAGEDADPTRMAPPTDPLTGRARPTAPASRPDRSYRRGEVFLLVAADALSGRGQPGESGALGRNPGTVLPECSFRGRENRKFQFAVLAAAAQRGGAEADLLDEVAWWQTDDFWQYALFAAVAYVRIAADRVGVPVPQICRALAQLPGSQPG